MNIPSFPVDMIPPHGAHKTSEVWTPNSGQDPARSIDPSRLRFLLPKITAGPLEFIWPVGVEGFHITGSSQLGIHKYIGADHVAVQVVHKDERRIELSGTFPGLSSTKNMDALISILTSAYSPKILYLPGVLNNAQNVFYESYDYNHSADDRTHSIDYTVTFVRTTAGKEIKNPIVLNVVRGGHGPAEEAPGGRKGVSSRAVSVSDGSRSLRGISAGVYGSPDQWAFLAALNQEEISRVNPGLEKQGWKIALTRWPVGTRIAY